MIRRRFFSSNWSKSSNSNGLSPFPKRQCHFCNLPSIIVPPVQNSATCETKGKSVWDQEQISQEPSSSTLPLSTGSIDNWFCSHCQCWNRMDEKEEGGMKSWENGMKDEKVNIGKRSVSLNNGFPTSILPDDDFDDLHTKSDQIFCHSCQTNQTLVLSMINNYEFEGKEEFDLQTYEKWKSDIEKRYPSVCSNCKHGVEERLKKADQRARALIWNDLLRKQKGQSRVRNSINSTINYEEIEGNERKKAVSKISPNRITIKWYLGLLCFILSWSIDFVILFGKESEFDTRSICISISTLLLLHFIVMLWDPSLPQQVKLTSSSPHVNQIKIEGLYGWRTIQWLIFILRAINVLLFMRGKHFLWINKVSFMILQFAFYSNSYQSIRIQVPPKISLKSRNLSERLHNSQENQNDGPNFGNLTLQDGAFAHTNGDNIVKDLEENDELIEGEDSMDWSPSIPSQWNHKVTHEYTLGPQKFFEPVKNTGLEELLSKNLELQEKIVVNEGEPMDIDTEVQIVKRSKLLAAFTNPVLFFIFALTLAFAILIQTRQINLFGTVINSFHSIFFKSIQNWWSSAVESTRQRSPYQGLWQPSFEKSVAGDS